MPSRFTIGAALFLVGTACALLAFWLLFSKEPGKEQPEPGMERLRQEQSQFQKEHQYVDRKRRSDSIDSLVRAEDRRRDSLRAAGVVVRSLRSMSQAEIDSEFREGARRYNALDLAGKIKRLEQIVEREKERGTPDSERGMAAKRDLVLLREQLLSGKK